MSRNNRKFENLLENKVIRIVISVLCAIALWTFVSATKTTVSERTVTALPVQIQLPESFTDETGLSIYGDDSFTVDVTVSGPSYMINSASFAVDGIQVGASVAEVVAPGEYDLAVTAKTNNDSVSVIKVSQSTVHVTFDSSSTKTFPLTEEVTEGENYKLAAGLIRENPTLSADKIEITGPSSEIAKITGVKAVAELDAEVKATTRLEAKIVFESDTESDFDDTNISYDKEEKIYITIPVSKSGTYDAKVDFTNVPADFRDKGIEYTISPSQANIVVSSSSKNPVVSEDGTVIAGTIDMSMINNEVNYIRITNDSLDDEPVTFTVRIDMSDKYKRWIEIPVDTSNAELPKNVKVNSKSVKSVQIIGSEKTLSNVDDSVAYAVPNLDGVNLKKPGTYTVPAKIILRALTDAWVYNTYQLEITVS